MQPARVFSFQRVLGASVDILMIKQHFTAGKERASDKIARAE